MQTHALSNELTEMCRLSTSTLKRLVLVEQVQQLLVELQRTNENKIRINSNKFGNKEKGNKQASKKQQTFDADASSCTVRSGSVIIARRKSSPNLAIPKKQHRVTKTKTSPKWD